MANSSPPPSRHSGPPPPPATAGELPPGSLRQDGRLRALGEFSLHDVEAIRLILRGASIIDWHRLDCSTEEQARQLVGDHGVDLSSPEDVAFTEHLRDTAIGYLRRHFNFSIPKPVERASMVELILMASGKGHRQLCACSILKTVHIISHMTGRELLFRLPVSDKDVFHLVEEKIYRIVGTMLSEGFPITEFIGGRKNLDSTYTKLLSKSDSTAAALYDKLRFRIVTRTIDDILPVLLYMTEHIFPFNYVVPGESTNTMFDFRRLCEQHPHLSGMVESFQGEVEPPHGSGDNRFSAKNYRVISFVADVPVRVPPHIMDLAPPGCEGLGSVVFVLCEFQMLDADTDASNEVGEASHEAYKERQRKAVYNRLRLAGPKVSEEASPTSAGPGSGRRNPT